MSLPWQVALVLFAYMARRVGIRGAVGVGDSQFVGDSLWTVGSHEDKLDDAGNVTRRAAVVIMREHNHLRTQQAIGRQRKLKSEIADMIHGIEHYKVISKSAAEKKRLTGLLEVKKVGFEEELVEVQATIAQGKEEIVAELPTDPDQIEVTISGAF